MTQSDKKKTTTIKGGRLRGLLCLFAFWQQSGCARASARSKQAHMHMPTQAHMHMPTHPPTHLTMALRAASSAWLASCAGVSSADASPTASGGVSRQLPGEPDLHGMGQVVGLGDCRQGVGGQVRRRQQEKAAPLNLPARSLHTCVWRIIPML